MSGFGDIFGHARSLGVLRQAMRRGQVAHAYLFAGPPGVGKMTAARVFGAALNCATLPDDACGHCPSCRKTMQGNHPDYRELQRQAERTGILIEQVREMIKTLQYASYEGRSKVYVVEHAEEMTTEAANALLKTLEEPTARTVIVLVSSAPHLLLPTVVSRCQTLRFGLLPDEQVRAWVASSMNVGEDDAALIALLADGSIGRAASLDLEYLRGARLTLFTDLAAAPANDTVAALALAERLLEVDPELRQGLDLLGSFVRDAVVWRLEGERRVRNRDVLPLIESYAGRMTTTNLSRKIRSLTQAKRLVERNVAKTAVAAGLCVDLLSPQPTAFTRGRLPR